MDRLVVPDRLKEMRVLNKVYFMIIYKEVTVGTSFVRFN